MSFEEELQGGIRNALERGVPVEKVIQTFINAGYSPADVQSAARAATEGATTIAPQAPSSASLPVPVQPAPASQSPVQAPSAVQPNPSPAVQPQPVSHSSNSEEEKPSTGNLKIILLVVVLIVLLGALAGSLLFREEILGMFA